MAGDERQLEEIRRWFDEQGYELIVHDVGDGRWRAPFMRKNVRVGSADYGIGRTAVEAAEDAKKRLEAVEHELGQPTSSTTAVIGQPAETDIALPVTPVKTKTLGTATEKDTAQPIKPADGYVISGAGAIPSEEAFGIPQVEKALERLTGYGWRVWFEEEPDGRVLGLLQDYENGQILKSARGEDHEDAWLGLGIDTHPPSQEIRREQRRSDDT